MDSSLIYQCDRQHSQLVCMNFNIDHIFRAIVAFLYRFLSAIDKNIKGYDWPYFSCEPLLSCTVQPSTSIHPHTCTYMQLVHMHAKLHHKPVTTQRRHAIQE